MIPEDQTHMVRCLYLLDRLADPDSEYICKGEFIVFFDRLDGMYLREQVNKRTAERMKEREPRTTVQFGPTQCTGEFSARKGRLAGARWEKPGSSFSSIRSCLLFSK